jgi:hypothetical protein
MAWSSHNVTIWAAPLHTHAGQTLATQKASREQRLHDSTDHGESIYLIQGL